MNRRTVTVGSPAAPYATPSGAGQPSSPAYWHPRHFMLLCSRDMEQRRVRRRKRRTGSRVGREAFQWFSLIVLAIKKSYHWVLLMAIITFILMVGFAVPMFA